MCLTNAISSVLEKRYLNRITRKGRKVYKMVAVENGQYFPIVRNTKIPFKEGVNDANTSELIYFGRGGGYYFAGFHFFTTKKAAQTFMDDVVINLDKGKENAQRWAKEQGEVIREKFVIIPCKIRKTWITTVGIDGVRCNETGKAIVAHRAIFPKFDKKHDA